MFLTVHPKIGNRNNSVPLELQHSSLTNHILPSSPAFDGTLFMFLAGRGGVGLALVVCLEMSFIGMRRRTSRPPKEPELLVPCKSLSV